MGRAILETEPVGLKLGDDHDIVIPLQFARGQSGVAQGIRSRLKMIKGEWFADRKYGVPWFDNDIVTEREALLGQVFNETKARNEIRKAILDTPGTLNSSLKMSVEWDGATRTMSVEYEVQTNFGDTITDQLALEF